MFIILYVGFFRKKQQFTTLQIKKFFDTFFCITYILFSNENYLIIINRKM